MRVSGDCIIRPAVDADRAVLRSLVDTTVSETAFREIPAYFLRLAFDRPSEESRVAVAECRDGVAGFALFGRVAGALATGRLHFLTVAQRARRRGIGRALCDAAVRQLAARGVRLIIAEIPARRSPASVALTLGCGFVEAGRVADYYSDGIDLLLLQRPVPRSPNE